MAPEIAGRKSSDGGSNALNTCHVAPLLRPGWLQAQSLSAGWVSRPPGTASSPADSELSRLAYLPLQLGWQPAEPINRAVEQVEYQHLSFYTRWRIINRGEP